MAPLIDQCQVSAACGIGPAPWASLLYGALLGPFDAFWHLLNFAAPALGVAALATVLTKIIWRQALRSTGWWLLFYPAAVGGFLALVLGMLLWQRDGRMATYLLLVFTVALILWWRLQRVSPKAS